MMDEKQLNVHIKCRQCRTIITKIASSHLSDAHTQPYSIDPNDLKSNCPTVIGRTEVYLIEESLNQWIQDEIEKSNWTRGKLKCNKCSSNVGSFDFITGQKCDCRQFNQPSVHFIKSKIDLDLLK